VTETDAPLADVAGLRRIERMAIAWTGVGAAVFLVLGRPLAAVVLTGVSAASIVGFRGLQRVISALGPRDVETTDQTTHETRNDDGRHRLVALGRFTFLGLVLLMGISLGPEAHPGLVSGFSTLPAALMTEGFLQAVRAFRGKDDDDGDS
jgi:hypothetical protein